MKLHKLKIQRKYFYAVANGDKTFELRKNDRDYEVGDLITFDVVDDEPPIDDHSKDSFLLSILGCRYCENLFIITYILKDVPQFGLDKDYCILGIKPMERVRQP